MWIKKPLAGFALTAALLTLAGCSSVQPPAAAEPGAMAREAWPSQLSAIAQADALPHILLLGEQHDAPAHQQWELDTVQWLIQRQRLAALVLEMAHAGHSTQQLPASATPQQVQAALAWPAAGWPWERYAPVVMTAVRAGIPVAGGNLAREDMRSAMALPQWDTHLPDAAWQRQREAIDTGHCGLLPAAQITSMARVQLAKDARMAQTAMAHIAAGQTVLLVAGGGHVLRSVGIPTWLPAHLNIGVALARSEDASPVLSSDRNWLVQTPALPPEDLCTPLRAQWEHAAPDAAPAKAAAPKNQQKP